MTSGTFFYGFTASRTTAISHTTYIDSPSIGFHLPRASAPLTTASSTETLPLKLHLEVDPSSPAPIRTATLLPMATALTHAHPLLQAFHASKPAFGAWLTLPGAFNARAAASASPHLSWVVIDCEHGMTALHPGAGESVQAITGLGPDAPSAIVRIPATGACADGSAAWQIKYVLDQGARGVLVPMVSNRAQAASIVSAARFPPTGVRGFGNPFTQLAWGPGVSVADYLQRANKSVIVLVQIETRDGYSNLEEILSVDGLDGVFIGPYDLSLSHGFPAPSPDPHPEVEKMIQNILATAHAKGKKCAFFCTSGAQSAQRAKEGFDMINVTTDSGAMADGLSRHFAIAVGEVEPEKKFGY